MWVCGLVLIMALLFSFCNMVSNTYSWTYISKTLSKKGKEGSWYFHFFIFYNVSTSQKLGFCSLWMFGLAQDFEEQWGENLRQSSNAEVEFVELVSKSHFSLHGSRELCKMRALYVLSLHKVLRKGKLSYKSRLFRHHVLGSVNSIFNQIYAHLDSINPNCPKCGRVHILFSNH